MYLTEHLPRDNKNILRINLERTVIAVVFFFCLCDIFDEHVRGCEAASTKIKIYVNFKRICFILCGQWEYRDMSNND